MANRICCLFVFLAVLGTCLAADCEYIARKYEVDDYFRVGDKNFTNIKYINGTFELHVAVKAASDGHIVLSPTPHPAVRIDPVYEIALGSGSNQNTDIRRNRQVNSIGFAQTPDVLSSTEFRSFYIKISKGGLIEVGREGSPPLVSCTDPNPLNVTYFSFSSWVNTEAVFKYDCPLGNNSEQGSLVTDRSDSNVTELFVEDNYTDNVENSTIEPEQKLIVNETGSSVDEKINNQLSDENSNKTLSSLDEAVNKTIDDDAMMTKVSSLDSEINKNVNNSIVNNITVPVVDNMNKNIDNNSSNTKDEGFSKKNDKNSSNKTYQSVDVEENENVNYTHNDTVPVDKKKYSQTAVPEDADEKNIGKDIHMNPTLLTLDEGNNKTVASMLNNTNLYVGKNSSKSEPEHDLGIKTSVRNITTVPCGDGNNQKESSKTENEITLKISGTGIKGALFAHLDLAIYGDKANTSTYRDNRQNQDHYRPYPYVGSFSPQNEGKKEISSN